uniref:Uncharacterized protein n=1 Tax=Eutreptiella gymnastica TaxID=73025 RepID=A0A6T1YBC3_9EUGL
MSFDLGFFFDFVQHHFSVLRLQSESDTAPHASPGSADQHLDANPGSAPPSYPPAQPDAAIASTAIGSPPSYTSPVLAPRAPIGTRGAGVGVAQRVSVPQISFRRKLFPSPAAVRWRAYGSPGSLDPR